MRSILGWALAMSCGSALAAGPYDGVYQQGLNPAYYSVHQNGNTLLVASLASMPANAIAITLGASVVHPSTIDYWTYSIGAIFGNTARVTGVGIFGACSVTTDIVFDGAGTASATFVGVANTLFGNQQGVNCSALYQSALAASGPTISLRLIF
jgi:hypothetical protein